MQEERKRKYRMWFVWSILLVIILGSSGCVSNKSIESETDSLKEWKYISEKSFEELAKEPIYPITENIVVADKLVEQSVFLEQDISAPIEWEFSDATSRAIPYRMNAFVPVMELVCAYQNTQEEKYIEKAWEITESWLMTYGEAEGEVDTSLWAWHDDATARRTYVMSVLYEEYSDLIDIELKECLKASLDFQASVLAQENFYKKNHNHGMYQDLALTMYALVMENEESSYYLDLAKTRVLEYFEYVVGEDGVHKEHSPVYHCEIAKSIDWFRRAYQLYDSDFSNKLSQLLDRMGDYVTWITMPDGTLPSIGDSTRALLDYDLWIDNEGYLYVFSDGERGIAPKENMKVFENGGYGVIRSGWEDEKETWILLTAATHSGAHKHNDDLNFLIYYDEQLIFTEGGNRNYNYLEEETQYCYSSYAHNVLLMEDEGWKLKENGLPSLEDSAYNTRIIAYDNTADVKWIQGIQTRFPGVEQKRTVFYAQDESAIQIRDDIEVKEEQVATLLYHIADGIMVKQNSDGWMLERDGKTIMSISTDATEILEIDTVLEDTEKYSTFIYEGQLEGRKGTTLVVRMKCSPDTDNFVKLNITLGADGKLGNVDFEKICVKKETAIICNEDVNVMTKDDIEVNLIGGQIQLRNTFFLSKSAEYAWYIYKNSTDEEPILKTKYGCEPVLEYDLEESGIYIVKAFVKDENDKQSVTFEVAVE